MMFGKKNRTKTLMDLYAAKQVAGEVLEMIERVKSGLNYLEQEMILLSTHATMADILGIVDNEKDELDEPLD